MKVPSRVCRRLKLTGESGLLGQLTKMVVEGALEGEMDDHLGWKKPIEVYAEMLEAARVAMTD